MRVIYRITSIASINPSPILEDDKNSLNEFCLKSFLKAFSDIKPKITFLADNCTCKDMIINLCNDYKYDFEIIETHHGINEAMVMSYEIASNLDDFVLFQECDYLYKGICGDTFVAALEKLKLVSPYDHLNFYKNEGGYHSKDCKIELVNNHHFRSTERNTMTWGCHSNLIKENLEMLRGHGYLDGPVWVDLLEAGYPLYVPIPSMATHMAKYWIAPGVDWNL